MNNNNNNNRINPLVITNLLLAVIAGCLLWNIVGPSVEPQAQAQSAQEIKELKDWRDRNAVPLWMELMTSVNAIKANTKAIAKSTSKIK